MDFIKSRARAAGFFYLLLVLVGPFRLMYIPETLIVRGSATATASNIAANELLFRLGIVSDLLTGTLALAVTFALYRLLKGVDHELAVLMVVLGGLMVTPIYFVNTINDAAALLLVRGSDALSALDKPQRDALALLFLRLHHAGEVANELFWGLWLFPFGVLTIRSGFIPRFLGIWLILNGFAYVILSLMGILSPGYEATGFNIALPFMLGEIAIMLWLLIMGAREQRITDSRASG